MKLMVISDLHGASAGPILQKASAYDGLIFLGDGWEALSLLTPCFPRCYAVRGNCDASASSLPDEQELLLEGKRLLITHGHRYRVKWGTALLTSEGHARGCDAILFGHTHLPTLTYDGGIGLFNPGAASGLAPTYGVLEVRRDGILFSVARFDGGVIL